MSSRGSVLVSPHKYRPSPELRIHGAPVPVVAFHWEGPPGEEQWIDFITPAPLLFAGSNVVLLALLAGLPVGLVLLFRRPVLVGSIAGSDQLPSSFAGSKLRGVKSFAGSSPVFGFRELRAVKPRRASRGQAPFWFSQVREFPRSSQCSVSVYSAAKPDRRDEPGCSRGPGGSGRMPGLAHVVWWRIVVGPAKGRLNAKRSGHAPCLPRAQIPKTGNRA